MLLFFRWQTRYGNFAFDRQKFPDMKALISKLNDMGFRTTLWIFPFFNIDCDEFNFVSENTFAVTQPNSTKVSITSWWDGGMAAILDFTNSYATEWYVGQLNKIRNETGIDSFKFDAGTSKNV